MRTLLPFVFAGLSGLLTGCGGTDSPIIPGSDTGGSPADSSSSTDSAAGDSTAGDSTAGDSTATDSSGGDVTTTDGTATDTGSTADSGLPTKDTGPASDTGIIIGKDTGLPGKDTGVGGCKTACDCSPGFSCVLSSTGGSCISAFVPVYCCESKTCPTGSQCQKGTDGTMSKCP